MQRIYKYPIPVQDEVVIELPKGSEILTIQMQKAEPCMWVLCNPEAIKVRRFFYLYGTGMEVKEGLNYLGTFQMLNGGLVFHLFED